MKRILTIVSVLSLVMATSAMALDYGWSVSLSDTDASVDTGAPDVAFATTNFYLWLACASNDGAAAAAMDIVVTGGGIQTGFTGENFIINAGSTSSLQLAIGGCPHGPVMVGTIAVLNTTGTGAAVCLEGQNQTVDCDQITPTVFDHAVHGASTDASLAPCGVDFQLLCGPVSTAPSSWGAIKGLYR
jgi:hypothetical protein